jgi:pyruvate dehydrogenase E2 component (dihydrolipoamide acetyltransferase)
MRVRTTVHVRSEDGAKTAVLKPGDVVPDWAEVANRDALLDAPEADEPAPAPAQPVEAPAAPVEPEAPATKPAARRKPAAKAAEPKAE